MGISGAIEWTEVTWNPVTGCDRVSAGCEHCYALSLARRLKAMGAAKYQHDGDPRPSGPGFGVTPHPGALAEPYGWRTPRVVFVNSMSDLFHAKVPLAFVQEVFNVIAETPQHTYQILTKRSLRLRRLADQLRWPPNLWMGVWVELPVPAMGASSWWLIARRLTGLCRACGCPDPGLVSLRRLLGSRTRAFAALTQAATDLSRAAALSGSRLRRHSPFLCRWETSWLARAAWCAGSWVKVTADSLYRRSGHLEARTAQIPKLIVQVRFPSPAPAPKAQVRTRVPSLGLARGCRIRPRPAALS